VRAAERRLVGMKTRTLGIALVLGLVPLLTCCLAPTADGNLVPKTVDGDPSLPRVELNGSVFHAEAFGEPAAPVIVVLHGGPGQDYRGLLRLRRSVDGGALEEHHRVVFWDQRGSGLSRRHDPGQLTLAAYDADLLAIIEHYSPGRPVVLLTHSWGGMYASFFIGAHPDRVAGAVLMEPGPLTGALFDEVKSGIQEPDFGSEWLNDLAWGQAIVTPDGHARADYIQMLGALGDSAPRFHNSTTDRMPRWRYGAVASRELMRQGMSHGKPVWDFTVGLDRFQKPVLFIGSELNEVIGAEFQKRQMKFYPQSQLAVMAGAGHDHPWTHPEETLRPVFSYLAAIGF
jgi:proline iminopeptidase